MTNSYQQWLTDPHAQRPDPTDKSTVTISRDTFERLSAQAAAFRDLQASIGDADGLMGLLVESPGVRELLMEEWAAHQERQGTAESSRAVSRSGSFSRSVTAGELQARRNRIGRDAEEFAARHGGQYRGGPVEWSTGRTARRAEDHDLAR